MLGSSEALRAIVKLVGNLGNAAGEWYSLQGQCSLFVRGLADPFTEVTFRHCDYYIIIIRSQLTILFNELFSYDKSNIAVIV